MKPKKNPELEIGRNSSLYFAIGLNIMLFLTWQALEFKTFDKDIFAVEVLEVEEELEEEIPLLSITPPPPPAPPPTVVQETITIVEDIEEIEETIIESTEANQSEALEERIVEVSDVAVEEVEEEVEVPFAAIEDVPIYPGCEGLSRAEMKDCFQKKVQAHVVKNFKYPEVAVDLGIQGRVSVLFVIDANGYTTRIRSRGPDKSLEKEAERIISLLPQMTPGKQRGKAVKVSYAIPIFFKLE